MAATFSERFGPWAAVTGASSGIGREFALQIAALGVDVVLSGRDPARLEAVAAGIRAMGRNAECVVADLATQAGTQEFLARASEREIGLVVPAAGFGAGGEFTSLAQEEALQMVRLNCENVTSLLLHFAPPMRRRGRGGILLVASMLAYHGVPYAGLYAATKAFVQSVGEALAVEMAGTGVSVLVSSPGPVKTGFAARARMRLTQVMDPADVAATSLAALGRSQVVLPGGLTKLLHHATFGLPRSLKVRIMGRIMRGMT